MNRQFRWQNQWTLMFALGTIFALIYRPNLLTLTEQPEAPATPASSGWIFLRVKFFPDQPPVVEEVKRLEEFPHPSATLPGEKYRVQVTNAAGEILHEEAFDMNFTQAADLPGGVISATQIFRLPDAQGAQRVVVISPQGKVSHEIPPQ